MTLPTDPTWYSDVQAPLEAEEPGMIQWAEEADVVIVGFGGAGACAAIEAADNGAKVLVVESVCSQWICSRIPPSTMAACGYCMLNISRSAVLEILPPASMVMVFSV